MLYMVECRFNDAAREQAWSDWYSGERLGELLSVPGFNTSQRFIAVTRPPTVYLAVHSIDSLRVFDTPEYRAMGGGGFQDYQECIVDWKRQFFEDIEIAPAVGIDQCLAVTDSTADHVRESGIDFSWMRPARRDEEPAQRGIAVLKAADISAPELHRKFGVDVYRPIMSQRLESVRSGRRIGFNHRKPA